MSKRQPDFRLIVENAPVAIAVFDRDMRYLAASRRWLTSHQLQEASLVGRSHYDVVPDLPERWKAAHRRGLAGEVVRHDNDCFTRANGSVHWLRWELQPWYAADASIGGIIIVTEDITERRRAEEALRTSEAFLKESQRVAGIGHYVLDTVTGLWTNSEALDTVFGIGPDFQRDLPAWDKLLHPDDREQMNAYFRDEVLGRGKNFDHDYRIIRVSDGAERWVQGLGRLRFDAAGKVVEMFGTIQDITERKRAEDLVRDREERYRATLASMTDLVFALDRDDRFVDYHAPGMTGLMLPPDQFLGKPFAAVLPAIIAEPLAAAVSALRGGAAVQHMEYELEINGKRTLWSANVSPRQDRTGAYSGATIVARDMTERQFMAERLRQAEKLAAIGQLAAGVAHDFNNQLSVIMGYADMLDGALEDPELKSHVQDILATVRRTADLTHKLLAFGRKGKYLTRPVDIHHLLTEVGSILERSIDRRIRVNLHFMPGAPPLVLGDTAQLQNALLNLALNARDAMPEGGTLTLETQAATLDAEYCRNSTTEIAPGHYVRISVADTGCGMSEEVKKHLFEPFFTTKKPGQGTGMGLPGVYGAVSNHHGTINVYSELGRGTTIRICLPVAPGATQPTPAPAATSLSGGTGRILVAEDEDLLRQLSAEMLRRLGYHVTTCADGREAVDYYQENWREIDLVILDMVMPEMGGRDAYLAMRRINPRIRALLSSGYSVDGEAQSILDEGVLGFLGKPYQVSELAAGVAAALAPASHHDSATPIGNASAT